ncbi:type VII secretion protein EccB [Mycobacterium spongiae]|uniref:Type VII secretion protein EccB n=1 Tax=Mycobacterium spongiae TaxID=886343 RepID=A0A975K330_9MYCO|nr:type VII secretion protein EccB [Mycobacterium spongiae]
MPGPTSTWLHVSGYRFLVRRIESALQYRDIPALGAPLRARTASLAVGCLLAAVAVVGYGFVAVLRPQAALGDAQIVMGRESGALYVRVGDTWHPVLNLASARLIAPSAGSPRRVRESALGRTKRGPMLGIPGAPQLVSRPLSGDESAWTICDSHGDGSTTVIVGLADRAPIQRLAAGTSILVASSFSSPVYLLYGGRRAVVDLADPAIARALRLEGRAPQIVAQSLLTAVPEVPPIAVPRIRSGGRVRSGLPGFPVGSVVRVGRGDGDEYYVVLRDGVQRIGQFAADVLRFAATRGTSNVISVAPELIGAAQIVNTLPVSTFPDSAPAPVHGPWTEAPTTVCVTWSVAASGDAEVDFLTGSAPPVPPGQVPVTLAQADGRGPALDAVYLPPGRSAYVAARGLSGDSSRVGTRYLVTDTGVRFGIHDGDAGRALGLPSAAIAAPWPILATLPAGPELSRAQALLARDAVAVGPP